MSLLLVGDSIRLGYQPVVMERLGGVATVRATSENCGSTRDILRNFDCWVTSLLGNGAVVHLNAGLHDLRRVDGSGGEPQVPIDEYRANLDQILDRLADDEACVGVVISTSTPIDDIRHQALGHPNRFQRDVGDYNAALGQAAKAYGAVVHDLCAVISVDTARYLDDDGVHLTRLGNVIAGRAVAAAVRAAIDGGS